MIEIKTYSKPKKTGGSGGSSSSTKYISGVVSEAEHAGRADKAKRAEVADQANYAGTAASAQNAAYASEAGNLREDAEILQQYLSLKDTADPQVVNGMVIFAKGLITNLIAQLKGGASFGSDGSYSFDKDGNLVIESAHSRDFDEMLQNGFALKRNPTSGKYTLSISDLIVWGRMVINTLETRKKYAIGGNVYLSGASSKIQHVEKVYSEDGETVVGYKCYILKDDGTMATQNGWVVGDQALCQTFDIEEGVYQNVSNQYYWRLVTQVSEENVAITEKYIDKDGNEQIRELYEGQKFAWVVLSKDDCDTNSGVPASGDTIVMDGHRLTENEDIDYTERTNVLMLEATGSGSPRIIALTGIVDYKHDTDNEVFILSPQKVIFTTEHFEIRAASGAPITFVHFMGPWVKGTEYHYYDQVSHANALWTCIVEKGKSTTDEPTDGNTYWRKEMSGGKGEKGDDAVIYTLEASPGYVRLSSDGSIDYTNGYIDKGDEYGSDKYLVVRGYKVVKGVRDNRFSTEASPVTLRLTINDGSAYSEYTPSDGDSVSIDFEPKYGDSYYSMLEEISHSGLKSVRVDMCEGSEYNPNKILATLDIPIVKDGQKGDDAASYNINFVTYKDDVHNDTLLYVYVVRSVGKESTSTLISNIPEISETAGLEVRVYCDGVYNENLTNHVKWSGSIQRSAWETVKNFEVRLYLNDKLVTSNSYSFGEQGESALEIIVTPETLVFDTGDDGLVPSGTSKQASISCYRNGVKVTNVSYIKSVEKNCSASVSESNSSATVIISEITSQEVVDTSGNSSTISNTSGYTTIRVWDKDTNLYHRVQVKFVVNVAKFTGQMVNTNKRFSNTLTEVGNKVDNKMDSFDLNEFKAEITQTAREISLSVSEKAIGRRNLLIGSAARRQGEGWTFMNGGYYSNLPCESIEINSGHEGVNAIHCRTKQTDTGSYYLCGFRWVGTYSSQGNIKLEKGKSYTLSFWAKAYNSGYVNFISELIWQGNATDNSRPAGYTGPNGFSTTQQATKNNTWTLFKVNIEVPSDVSYEYVEVNIFARATNYTLQDAYICKPMLEEGDYNGWTLSTEDYDYVGGNMLDNTLSLDKSGSLYDVNGTLTPVGFGESTSIYKSFVYKLKGTVSSFSQLHTSGNTYGDTYFVRNTEICYRYNGSEFESVGNDFYYNVLEWRKLKSGASTPFGLEANKDYVFSFMAKGTGKLTAYFYSPETVVFVESSLGETATRVDGAANFQLTSDWKKYWVHWRPSDSSHKYVLLRLNRTIQSSEGDAPITNCYIAQPKLEAGAVVTEYTERKSDLVDKASLKAAGIEITSDQVTLYGNKVQVKTPKANPSEGYDEAAMFQNGKLNAKFINAGDVVAKGINAQVITATKLNVTGDSKIGIWSIKKDDNWGDIMQAEGTEYNGATVVTGIQYCPLFVRGGSPNTAYFRVGASCTEFSYQSTLNYFNAVWFGDAARIVCKGSVNNVNLPTNYDYNTQYEPVQYIYSEQSKQESPALAINVIAKGFSGTPTAIQTNGAIRGVLAPNAMSISWGQTIPNDVGVVICTNDSDMTLTLPANPVEGQTLIIIQGSTSKVYIVPPKGDTIYWGGQTRYDTGNRFYSGTIGQFTILVFIRRAWQLQFMNNRP